MLYSSKRAKRRRSGPRLRRKTRARSTSGVIGYRDTVTAV